MEQNHSDVINEFEQQKKEVAHKHEMKHQLVSFGLMIILTILAFISVASGVVSEQFTMPFILILALVQVLLQLYYFMHLNQKGHAWPNIMIWSAIIVAIPMVAALMFLLGIVKY